MASAGSFIAIVATLTAPARSQFFTTNWNHVEPHRLQRGRLRMLNDRGLVFSDECTTTDGDECASDGSTNYHNRSGLSYDPTTGKFSGTFVTNQCNDQFRQYGHPEALCIEQTIPPPFAERTPASTPVLGRAAMTISGGVNVYSAFENGFDDGQACDGGSCVGGLDVMTCEKQLEHTCDSSVNFRLFMDSCGGHASPYHIHTDPICNYHTTASGHSSIVAISMDGYGVYGKYESDDQRPCDLDVCHGHFGPVPADEEYGIPASIVYHYHVMDHHVYPGTWTLGCYGSPDAPVTLEDCYDLYDECGDDSVTVFTEEYPDGVDIDPFCPCFEVPVSDDCVSSPSQSPPSPEPVATPTASPPAPKPTRPPRSKPTLQPASQPTPAPSPKPTLDAVAQPTSEPATPPRPKPASKPTSSPTLRATTSVPTAPLSPTSKPSPDTIAAVPTSLGQPTTTAPSSTSRLEVSVLMDFRGIGLDAARTNRDTFLVAFASEAGVPRSVVDVSFNPSDRRRLQQGRGITAEFAATVDAAEASAVVARLGNLDEDDMTSAILEAADAAGTAEAFSSISTRTIGDVMLIDVSRPSMDGTTSVPSMLPESTSQAPTVAPSRSPPENVDAGGTTTARALGSLLVALTVILLLW